MDIAVKSDIETNFKRVERIFNSGIFDGSNIQNLLMQSALIELLIRVRDLMAKSRIYSDRIKFNDDIIKTNNINNFTDLIKFIRDAVCQF